MHALDESRRRRHAGEDAVDLTGAAAELDIDEVAQHAATGYAIDLSSDHEHSPPAVPTAPRIKQEHCTKHSAQHCAVNVLTTVPLVCAYFSRENRRYSTTTTSLCVIK